MSRRTALIDLGFRIFHATGLHRAMAPFTRGMGVILMFHRVRPAERKAFAPNQGLEITPEFFEALLAYLKQRNFRFASLDDLLTELQEGREAGAPTVALTFDDGYRDTAEAALPIMERYATPFTVYVTTGFAERTARLWWVELERAIAALNKITFVEGDGKITTLSTESAVEKNLAFKKIYWDLRAGAEERLLATCKRLYETAGLSCDNLAQALCLDWEGVKKLSDHPLATIGAHTLTHPMLAKHDFETMRKEIEFGRILLEKRLGKPIKHFSYPVGDPTSAGVREFAAAQAAGYVSAVTTRPGLIFSNHKDHFFRLPRVSINGAYQNLAATEVLLSGAPFLFWNKGRRMAH